MLIGEKEEEQQPGDRLLIGEKEEDSNPETDC